MTATRHTAIKTPMPANAATVGTTKTQARNNNREGTFRSGRRDTSRTDNRLRDRAPGHASNATAQKTSVHGRGPQPVSPAVQTGNAMGEPTFDHIRTSNSARPTVQRTETDGAATKAADFRLRADIRLRADF
ncbi:hypothetical protein [Nocardia sp. BMG111209]|uniref:hypothetical protein n=1 Tax=Nocardia sp. BMG111209 TaxID=1160137 RepID=UPI00350EA763